MKTKKGISWADRLKRLDRGKYCYLMFLPVFIYFVIFYYVPMYGIIISFQDYSPFTGFFGSPWVGLKHFKSFFDGFYFWQIMWNTLYLNILNIVFTFPFPIIFALLLNEVKNIRFKKTVQTVSYLPHFISVVVIVGIVSDFFAMDGVINKMIVALGGEAYSYMSDASYFRGIYVGSGLWQELGWNAIIYIAALSGINAELYEAATIDGAGRLRKLWHITIPGIAPTIIITLLLSMSAMITVGFDKIFLMQNSLNTQVSEVISTYVYKRGIESGSFSFATAVGLFNNIINVILIAAVNKASKKINDVSLW